MKAIKNAKIGDKAGRLTLIDIKYELGGNKKIRTIFYCLCDCGIKLPPMQPSSFGNKTSCGCKDRERLHHKAHTKIWRAWQGMKRRCYNVNNPKYAIYGGAGRFVCNGLKESKHFFKILGEPPTVNHSLDRKDSNGNYTCGVCEDCIKNGYLLNVHWATFKEQSRNVSTNYVVNYRGVDMCLSEACEKANVSYKRVFNRISYCGWGIEKALSEKGSLKERIIIDGMSLKELAVKYNVNKNSLRERLKQNNWDFKKALEKPILKRNRCKKLI